MIKDSMTRRPSTAVPILAALAVVPFMLFAAYLAGYWAAGTLYDATSEFDDRRQHVPRPTIRPRPSDRSNERSFRASISARVAASGCLPVDENADTNR
jgi:hypothetical protein